MKMKLSRILTLIVALGLLGSAVETIPSSVQLVEVVAAQKKTAKKKKAKKSTSKSKKKPVKKATSKSKKTVKKTTSKSNKKPAKKTTSKSNKKPAKKTTSKLKKKPVKKATSKSKKKPAKKTTSKSKKKTTKKTASKSKKKTVKKTTSKPTTNTKTNQPSTKPSTDQPSTKPSTEQPANKPSTDQPSTKPSTDQPADKPEPVKTMADLYNPLAQDYETDFGKQVSSSDLITNMYSLPEGVTFKFSKEPDYQKAGSYTTDIIAYYPDGSKNSTNSITVTVKPATDADIYEATVKDGEYYDGDHFDARNYVTNIDKLPEGTQFYDDYQGDDPNDKNTNLFSIRVCYPDGSVENTKPIKIKWILGKDTSKVEATRGRLSPNSVCLLLKVTNTSDKTMNFRASMEVADSHGKDLSGIYGVNEGPVAPNQTVVFWSVFYDPKPYYYDHLNYHVYASGTDQKSANDDLKLELIKKDSENFDIKATNIGSKKIYYPKAYAIIHKDGKLTNVIDTLVEPDDADGLQPGESVTKTIYAPGYDDVELSSTSSYSK
ncbi:hypothetical protein EFR34_07050 [Lactobacillus delbrueckii subsp. lactis]|nr:hypothetical protein [Lactobacillus delbrueckii subsp. lactis]